MLPSTVAGQSVASIYPLPATSSSAQPSPTAKMQVLAEAASREAELQPQQIQKQQVVRRIAASSMKQVAKQQPGQTATQSRLHAMSKAQAGAANQLTSKQILTGQKIVSQQNLINHKVQRAPTASQQQKSVQQNLSNATHAIAQQGFKAKQQRQLTQQKHQQQIVNANVIKSNSLPNLANAPNKFAANAGLVLAAKQTNLSNALGMQQTTQIQMQQQQVNAVSIAQQQIQRNQSSTNVRTQFVKSQQQPMLVKVAAPTKNHHGSLQSGGMKTVSAKLVNAMKTPIQSHSQQHQPVIQQPINRILQNAQNVSMVQQQQQQQQMILGPQNTQKQPGCIKTIAPQKPVQKNLTAKHTAVKMNTNLNAMKAAMLPSATVASLTNLTQQKGGVKMLLPQQQQSAVAMPIVGQVAVHHKAIAQGLKISQQAVLQQKPVVMTSTSASQFMQTIRPQTSQIRTLLPVSVAEPQKEAQMKTEMKTEIKAEIKTEIKQEEDSVQSSEYSQSSQRRMPHPFECLQFVLQDHNYGAPPPRTPPPPSPPPQPKQQPFNGAGNSCAPTQPPFQFNQRMEFNSITKPPVEDDAGSAISSENGREVEPEGEETETAPEGEGEDEDSVTRCVCDFEHDDGYMICCDRCLVWQHVDCMGIDRANIPDEYLCEVCRPRRVDRARARALQMRKREELRNLDSASDSSSTTSGDTDTVQVKNRKTSQSQSGSKKKTDPAPQTRRLNNNNNNNNVAKRQRRDTQTRQPSAVRNKKEATTPVAKQQRTQGKRKTKRRTSLEDKEEDTQDVWGSNMAPLRQWIERYEEAVTNHYSPELRARISSIKVNGTHNDLKQSNIGAAATGKCRLNIQSNNLRFLVATMYLPPNTPVVELRGKYMLSTQHRPAHPQGRQHAQRPGPFVFFYRLPRDGTEVCVDTRTYGNDARFVRRSCRANAEVKHCIEKGTLHLYIVTTTAIEKNSEITILHDQHDLMLSPNSNATMPVVCACNNPKECQITNSNPITTTRRGTNGPLPENADGRERRRRGRRTTVSEEPNESPAQSTTQAADTISAPPVAVAATPTQSTPKKTVTINPNVIVRESPSVSSINVNNVSSSANSNSTSSSSSSSNSISSSNNSSNTTSAITRQAAKEEQVQSEKPQLQASAITSHPPSRSSSIASTPATSVSTPDTKKDKKMTREERKMQAIMKAFERLEKAEQRKQEVQARNAQRKESGGGHSDNEDSGGHSSSKKQNIADRIPRRKRRKGRTRSTSSTQSQGTRRTRLNSAESDLTSGDESNSMHSPPLSNQHCSYSLRASQKEAGGAQPTMPAAADLLLALANSSAQGAGSPTQQRPALAKSPTCDSGASSSSQSSTPSTPLSSACLLVAAAVGPLAPGFKFPKTKKVLMNEWLKESPEPQPQAGDARAEFSCSAEQSSEFLSQNYAAKGLATLVQAVHSVAGVCDSPPKGGKQASAAGPGGSAKKRWLRQAISEECDSPNSSRPESPPSEMVAPPKKRRIARESLSSDNYTPPTTPTMQQDSMPAHRPSMNEDDFMEHMPSPNGEDIGSQNEYDSDQVKDDIKRKIKDETVTNYRRTSSISCREVNQSAPLVKVKMESKYGDDEDSSDFIKHEIKAKYRQSSECKSAERFSAQIKSEPHFSSCKIPKLERKPVKIEEIVERGTVEIVDQNEHDLEADDLSSPLTAMESEAELKKRVAELRLEFGGGLAALNEKDKSSGDETDHNKVKHEIESFEGSTSIDEFDVEAQMKKITGDDGDDFGEKVTDSAEREKSMDGIEILMDSSKEDSDSELEDRPVDEECNKTSEKIVKTSEQRVFREFESRDGSPSFKEGLEGTRDIQGAKSNDCLLPTPSQNNALDLVEKDLEYSQDAVIFDGGDSAVTSDSETKKDSKISSVITPEESLMELDSMELPPEEKCEEPPKVFCSIPPLSERIRKKVDSNSAPKLKLELETSIIKSSLDLELTKDSQDSDEKKKMLSTALRELLEAKIETDDESTSAALPPNTKESRKSIEPETNPVKFDVEEVSESIEPPSLPSTTMAVSCSTAISPTVPPTVPTPSLPTMTSPATNQTTKEVEAPEPKTEHSPSEPKRLKDPRTVVPNKPPPTPSKSEGPAPVKRKLSISEYRKRKQQSTGTPPETENSEVPADGKSTSRGRSDSASSGTSSLSSDDESATKTPLDLPSLPLFANADGDEKKGTDDGTIGWSAAPTLVERQRENLTERLKREFGLFLNDDEEERARKQGLNNEIVAKATNNSGTLVGTVNFPVSQLPPQPYIPPPGSASIHYTQYQAKTATPSVIPYVNYSVPPPPVVAPNYPPPPIAQTAPGILKPPPSVVPQPFVLPQAPPGSNPYPPSLVNAATALPPVPPPMPVPAPSNANIPVTRFSTAPAQTTTQPVLAYPVPSPTSQTQNPIYNHPTPRS